MVVAVVDVVVAAAVAVLCVRCDAVGGGMSTRHALLRCCAVCNVARGHAAWCCAHGNGTGCSHQVSMCIALETGLEPAISSLGGRRLIH